MHKATPPQQPKGTPKVIGVPLGSIIPRRLTDDATLVIRDAPRSPLAERYRSLVQRLVADHAQGRQSQQVITVTSAADPRTWSHHRSRDSSQRSPRVSA